MSKVEKFNEESSLVGAMIIKDHRILALAVAIRLEDMAKERNLPPSTYFIPSLISLDSYEDSWATFDFRSLHYLDQSKLDIFPDHKGIDLSISIMTTYFLAADGILPVVKCSHPADWPYVFLAQLQKVCEEIGVAPSDALVIFGIIYMGDLEDTWTNFKWMDFIHPMFLTVSLKTQRNIHTN
ncbi:hypothetical protein N9J91_00565 [Gammaproteobacteria bacterium]|nr:hypothetical protein [Gammaproteobacteria bacterium]